MPPPAGDARPPQSRRDNKLGRAIPFAAYSAHVRGATCGRQAVQWNLRRTDLAGRVNRCDQPNRASIQHQLKGQQPQFVSR